MEAFLLVAIGLALLVSVVCSLVIMVAAFRQSVLWGLAYLFIPGGSLVFIVRYWSDVKTSFLVSLAAGVLALIGIMAHPATSKGFLANAGLPSSMSGHDDAAALTAKIQEHRDRIHQLETAFDQGAPALVKQFSELEKKRKALKVSDTAAVAQFNDEAAAYQQQNAQRKVMLQEIETTRQDLSKLLAERSKITAASPGSGANASGQRIVMYTTARCPACKAAKRYMAQRGISYDEKDVEATPSYLAEFQQLGGRGVPLILVGDKRMEGFNPKAFEGML